MPAPSEIVEGGGLEYSSVVYTDIVSAPTVELLPQMLLSVRIGAFKATAEGAFGGVRVEVASNYLHGALKAFEGIESTDTLFNMPDVEGQVALVLQLPLAIVGESTYERTSGHHGNLVEEPHVLFQLLVVGIVAGQRDAKGVAGAHIVIEAHPLEGFIIAGYEFQETGERALGVRARGLAGIRCLGSPAELHHHSR